MDASPASEFLDASETVVELHTKRRVRIRRLCMEDLLDVPEAWPLFNIVLGELSKDDKEDLTEKLNAVVQNTTVRAAMLSRGVVDPKMAKPDLFLKDGEETDGAPLHIFDPIERNTLINHLTLFATGFGNFVDLAEAAQKAGQFSEASDAADGYEGGEGVRDTAEQAAGSEE